LIGEQYPREEFDENEDEFLGAAPEDIQGTGGTWQNTKSFLAFPYTYKVSEPPGRYILEQGEVPTLPAGQRTMRGYANSPFGIAKVEYSVDGGNTWQEATIVEPAGLPYSRVRFEFPWNATPGTHVLATRATDNEGNVQPERVPLNQLGILCNAIAKFQVEVT
jgi:Mo-co oxidoreductase dimerisation domain